MDGWRMRQIKNVFRRAAAWAFILVLLGGCATSGRVKKEKTAADFMTDGLDYYNDQYYLSAIENFQKIIDRYPYSKYYTEAELRLADSYYYSKKYDEAIDAYAQFQRLHPKNPNIPYVSYQKGQSYFRQVSTVDRDQSHTLQAKEEFERLIRNYPGSEYADRAQWELRECDIMLAESELYVGNFYFKMKKYKAAMNRYRYVLENYPDLGQYHRAIESLGKCMKKLAEEENRTKKSGFSFFSIF